MALQAPAPKFTTPVTEPVILELGTERQKDSRAGGPASPAKESLRSWRELGRFRRFPWLCCPTHCICTHTTHCICTHSRKAGSHRVGCAGGGVTTPSFEFSDAYLLVSRVSWKQYQKLKIILISKTGHGQHFSDPQPCQKIRRQR